MQLFTPKHLTKIIIMENFIRKYLLFVILLMLLSPVISNAQPGFEEDTRDVPVDGGLSILIAAGGAYVLRKKTIKKALIDKQ